MLVDPRITPFQDVEHVGLAITQVKAGLYHCGIVYRLDDQPAMMVHLAWHMALGHEPPTDRYFWLQLPQLSAAERKFIAIRSNRIGSNGPSVPYAFTYPGNIQFNAAGEIEGSRVGRGFTCATFVLSVFEYDGFQVVESAGWPEGANAAWQQSMIAEMRDAGVNEQHVRALQGQVGVRRIRPEEVVGCGELDDWPVVFNDAELAAAAIVAQVRALEDARV